MVLLTLMSVSMIKLLLTDQNIPDIHEALDDPAIDPRSKNRLLVIIMHHEGANNTFISSCMKLCPNTVTNYIKLYRSGGIGELIENRYYCPSSSLEPYMQCLECSFKIIPVQNAKDAVARIEKMTGLKLSESQARRIMKKMGMSLKKCSSIPAKADPQLQFNFYCEEMTPRLEEASRGERNVFFVDALLILSWVRIWEWYGVSFVRLSRLHPGDSVTTCWEQSIATARKS